MWTGIRQRSRKNDDAKKFTSVTHDQVLGLKLEVMDATAAALCRDNKLSIVVFNIEDTQNILRLAPVNRLVPS